MRKTIFALLLASAALSPALAQEHGGHGDGGGHGGGGHGQQAGGGGHPGGGQPAQHFQQPQARPQMGGNPAGGRVQALPQQQQGGHFQAQQPQGGRFQAQQQGGHAYPGGRGFDGGHAQAPAQNRGNYGGVPRANGGYDGRAYGRPGYGGQAGWQGDRGRAGGGWNGGWRQDRRYDWSGYRDSHREIFHPGAYRAPYGYGGYRRWGIGSRLAPIFFAQNYWIGDPSFYRLPPAYPPYRWVRYYNDALLVNVYTGEVADEIPDFFW